MKQVNEELINSGESCCRLTLAKRDHTKTMEWRRKLRTEGWSRMLSGSDGGSVCNRLCCYNHLPCSRLHAVSSAADKDLSALQVWPQGRERVGSRSVITLLAFIRQLVYSPCQKCSAVKLLC